MANAAILVGNANYLNLQALACCHHDVVAMKQLLEATEKYDSIVAIENASSDNLKQQLRNVLDTIDRPSELFFYFTGHGHAEEGELYHCAANFDSGRPNETGLSTSELHAILRLADAGLVVKVIDTCYSGSPLIKSEADWARHTKDGFQNIIQIASCLESQTSLAGDPLSHFTEKFRDAVLRKSDGAVFYTDIISTLRDDFLQDSSQTPHFVAQVTGREQFIDDAKRLDGLRKSIRDARIAATVDASATQAQAPAPMTLADRLRAADAQVATPTLMSQFVGGFLDDLITRVTTDEFAEFFDVEKTENARLEEWTSKRFIIRVLSQEKRPDNFVSADHSRKSKTRNPMFSSMMFSEYLSSDAYEERWELSLNCAMERAQIKITFTPKFTNLQQIALVVTCAPSLDYCYIFEIVTQHRLRDFKKYDDDGPEISRRWWKCKWAEGPKEVTKQIASKFVESVQQQLESAEKRLAGDG